VKKGTSLTTVKRAVRRDIGRIFMAIFLAILVWVYVAQKVVNSRVYSLNIRVVTGIDIYHEEVNRGGDTFFIILPESLMELSGPDDRTLHVTLSGPEERLPKGTYRLTGRYEITVQQHMQSKDRRSITVNLASGMFDALRKVEGVRASFNPPEIQLRLARRESTQIHLSAENNLVVKEKLPEDSSFKYSPDDVDFDPNPVEISGPAPDIQKIRSDPSIFKLGEIDISNVTGSDYSRDLKPSASMLTKKVSLLTQNNVVRMRLNLREKEIERELKGVPLVLLRKTSPLGQVVQEKLTPDSEVVDLVLRGPEALLRRLSEAQLREIFMPVVDARNMTQDIDNLPIKVKCSDDYREIRVEVKGSGVMTLSRETVENK